MENSIDSDQTRQKFDREEVLKPWVLHECDPAQEVKKKDCLFLYFAVFTANLTVFAHGCTAVWSSPVISKLQSTDLDVNPLGYSITVIEESWLASVPSLGSTVVPLLFGKFSNHYGRRKTLIFVAFIQTLCYVTLSFAVNFIAYCIVRFVLGACGGVLFAIVPMFVGEICEDHNRGKFGCVVALFIGLGTTHTFIVGPICSMTIFNLSIAFPLVICIACLILFIPETPVYLASLEDTAEAQRAIIKFTNKTPEDANKYYLTIRTTIEKTDSENGSFRDLFEIRSLRNGLIVCTGLFLLQQMSGVLPILLYLGPIFDASSSKLSTYVSSIIVILVQTLTVVLTSLTVEKLGRRLLLLASIIGCCLTTSLLGTYFHLVNIKSDSIYTLYWLPLTCLVLFLISFYLGVGSLPFAILGEIFPSNVKTFALLLNSVFAALIGFCLAFLFPIVTEFAGIQFCFWIFGGVCFLGFFFIYFRVPETKGKSLVKIQEALME